LSLVVKTESGKYVFQDTGEIIQPKYQDYTCPEDYLKDKVLPIAPMLAKDDDREEVIEKMLEPNSGYYVEEKFDGTRCLMHFYKQTHNNSKVLCKEDMTRDIGYARLFSRRIGVNGWYAENTDSMPHLGRIDFPSLAGTVIDGELFIPDRPFSDVSSTLNCLWGKAVERQIELGEIVLHAFDIIWYKGVYIARMPLWKRKHYLQHVVALINSPYVKLVPFSDTTTKITLPKGLETKDGEVNVDSEKYPNLYTELKKLWGIRSPFRELSKRAYYEYIVSTGGEGVILKHKDGQYFHKRGREYTKLKKFLTREVIILGFTEPTKEYKGKFPDPKIWRYWESNEGDTYDTSDPRQLKIVKDNIDECAPVSKYYAEGWVGNIRFGVIVTPEEEQTLLKSKKGKEFNIERCNFFFKGEEHSVLEVGECAGFDEEMREYFTKHESEIIGSVIEVKANEIFKDTGKLRHPRFLRMRHDKSNLECTWKDHIGG
jgi:hypothetical protein